MQEDLTYPQFVDSKTKDPVALASSISAERMDLANLALGLSHAAGILTGTLRKHAVYNTELNVDAVVSSMGDIEFHMQGIRNALELNRGVIIAENMDRMELREDGY